MIRRATTSDLAAFSLHEQAAIQAGHYDEWGGITHQDLARQLEDSRMELWAVEDMGTPRGYIRMGFGGLIQWATDTQPTPLWRYVLVVIPPPLVTALGWIAALEWVRLYLRSVREIALAHAGHVLEGSVVADSTQDRLWQRYVADRRTLREAPRTGGGTVQTAQYRGPAENITTRLAAV